MRSSSVSVDVRLPTVLRNYADGDSSVSVDAATIGEALDALASKYPALGDQLEVGDDGIPRFVNLYLNDEDVRYLDKLETKVGDEDVIQILPAVAGGSS